MGRFENFGRGSPKEHFCKITSYLFTHIWEVRLFKVFVVVFCLVFSPGGHLIQPKAEQFEHNSAEHEIFPCS